MKNIHVLPTDKKTRLFTSDSVLILAGYPATTFKTGKNIYITSDEALPYDSSIFDNGAFYHRDAVGDVHIITKHTFKPNPHFCKRIILTTDGDLIKDGVQAIDDEFLQWYVKNPSCEIVEVEEKSYIEIKEISYEGDFQNVEYVNYKIIIPKEEPKQEATPEEVAEYLGFVKGVKYQQEQDKNKFSKEDLIDAFNEGQALNVRGKLIQGKEWFEQYKNKL